MRIETDEPVVPPSFLGPERIVDDELVIREAEGQDEAAYIASRTGGRGNSLMAKLAPQPTVSTPIARRL